MTDDNAASKLLSSADPGRRQYTDSDRALFDAHLRDFVPPNAFDAHAHLYDLRHIVPQSVHSQITGSPAVDHSTLVSSMQRWMGDRVVGEGLYFPYPVGNLDCVKANTFLAKTLSDQPGSRGLMMIRPDDDPATVEATLQQHGFAGFKVYHVFAARSDSFHAEQGEFLPDWAWELADQHGLAIMMHMVLPQALSDERNQRYIVGLCRRYPGAKLVLAHAARGFNAGHTIDGIDSLRGLENVWFDTSAICESAAFEAIVQTFGVTRLLYGSDFPVSELRGRCVSVGDGFYWLHDDNADWTNYPHATPQLVGIESLLALQQACRRLHLLDRDIERLFADNARQMLAIDPVPTGDRGQQLYREAKAVIPGGTQLLSKRPEMFAPEKWPAYFEQAIGCEVVDADGRTFIDMSHCGILSCILGYSDPDVNAAVIRRVQLGSMATQQTAEEVELARLLTDIHPWADQARFTRSGGEAMAAAVRIARAATGKTRLAVCGYHGWHDWYLAANVSDSADPSDALNGHLLPGLAPNGVPPQLAGTVSTFQYNRLEELDAAIQTAGGDLAAIVMEPTRSVDPHEGFLEAIRERADRAGAVLIFDEISSGWRLYPGGAHRLFGVDPDLTAFAKGMSNGFAMGAVIGRATVMEAAQTSFISSTYWTEGVGPAAAVAAVKKMQRIDVPAHLRQLGEQVMLGWNALGDAHSLPVVVSGRPASCVLGFEHPKNAALLTLLTSRMLDRGFLASANCSLTLAHQNHHVQRYLNALDEVFAELANAIQSDDIEQRLDGPVKHSGFQRLVR